MTNPSLREDENIAQDAERLEGGDPFQGREDADSHVENDVVQNPKGEAVNVENVGAANAMAVESNYDWVSESLRAIKSMALKTISITLF